VALVNGLNANMLRKWVIDAEQRQAREPTTEPRPSIGVVGSTPCFMPLALPAPAAPAADIRIELRRGATTVNMSWPASAAEGCAAWLRELLR
jgi:transposase